MIVLCHQCQVDSVEFFEIHVEQSEGQLWVPSICPDLSSCITLGLHTHGMFAILIP